MRTIEWQDNDFDFEEEGQLTLTDKEKMSEECDREAYQLQKFQDPSKDIQRQEILSLTEKFGILLVNNNTEQIAIELLSDDFEAFIFSSSEKKPVQHYARPQGFINFWKGNSVLERHVRSTEVDSEKTTAWQVCEYKIIYEDTDDAVIEAVCEIFTVKNKRIVKYRPCFGPISNMNDFEKFLMPTRKDRMLSKVKEINYALAGEPDLEKLASLFNENTEFRIWRWGDHKCFTLYKHNFISGFGSIEDEMSIKKIVPYDVSVDTQEKFISGTYAYHLEERSSGKKFVWLSTCIYGFDLDANLARLSQQGELYPEEEVTIPFEVYSRDTLAKKATELAAAFDQEYNAFYNDSVLYDCKFYSFMPEVNPNPGYFQGLKHFDKVKFIVDSMKTLKFDNFNILDVYVDHYSESHEAVLLLGYVEVRETNLNREETALAFSIFYFENGKVARELDFISFIQSPIPSPFDDRTFQGKNIIKSGFEA